MEFNLLEGIKGNMEIVVSENDSASKVGSGLVDVYSTPSMIGLMENTAQTSVKDSLPEGYTTVGIDVSVKHMKATPIGMKVKCISTLKEIQGKKLLFEVEAYDEAGKIGQGTHTRYIVNHDDFIKNI